MDFPDSMVGFGTRQPARLSAARSGRSPDRGAAVNTPNPAEEFTVRFPDPGRAPERCAEVQVHATVNPETNTITFELPDKTQTTLDVVTARALQMILWEGVFGSLQPNGPRLRVERRSQH
jgi:hypothetical protein